MKRRWTHNVYITKLVEPEVINGVGRGHKVTFAELLVSFCGGDVELVKDPFLDETLVPSGLFVTRGRESQRTTILFYLKDGRDILWVWVRIRMSRQVST
jgi:hypothetical protein